MGRADVSYLPSRMDQLYPLVRSAAPTPILLTGLRTNNRVVSGVSDRTRITVRGYQNRLGRDRADT